jgi:hypothetical protein
MVGIDGAETPATTAINIAKKDGRTKGPYPPG